MRSRDAAVKQKENKDHMYDFLRRQSAGCLFWMFTAAAVALYLPLILWNAWPENDVAVRYAPMAEAFARGDFMYAFHPRCQMLHSMVAGIIAWAFGTNGFTACKLSALLFYILGALPLIGIARTAFGKDRIIPTLALYLLCYQIVSVLVAGGVRDSAKMFTLLGAAYYATRIQIDRDNILNYLLFGACCGLGVCVRGEMLLISIFLLLGMLALDSARHWICWRSVGAATAAMAVGSVELWINWKISGYAIPSHHLGGVFLEMFERIPTPGIVYGIFCLPELAAVIPIGTLLHLALKNEKTRGVLPWICMAAGIVSYLMPLFFLNEGMGWRDYAGRVFKGLSPVFFVTACIGIAVERKSGTWSGAKSVLLMMFALCEFLVLDQITYYDKRLYTSTRYLLAAVPLVLPWSAAGVEWMWRLLEKHCHVLAKRGVVTTSVICGALLCLFGAYRQEFNNRL
ncbi:MAG: glycosyltransferase family 39 protein, partial [Victivallaceae bacterium]|nr:glycosyltransferase family 39 protein [Victivallaceae bacterium]